MSADTRSPVRFFKGEILQLETAFVHVQVNFVILSKTAVMHVFFQTRGKCPEMSKTHLGVNFSSGYVNMHTLI